MDIFKRLVRIYTPFICAIIAIIHGVLYLAGYKGAIYSILNDLTGHSILLILFILSASKSMCIWYKITNYLLLFIHLINISYALGYVQYDFVLYLGLVINIIAVICFLIYRVTAVITKILC